MKSTAKNFTPGKGKRKPIRIIVLHSAENQELAGQADHLAQWFHSANVQASAHYMVDNAKVVQSVDDGDVAWHCDVWERNQESIGIELTGSASQTLAQWNDKYSLGVLHQASILCARLSKLYAVPPVHLSATQILDGRTKGYATHHDITDAHKVAGGHTDPGAGFPLASFLGQVNATIKGAGK